MATVFFIGAEGITDGSDEHRLREFLLKDHAKDVRPVLRASEAVIVTFGLKLGQLVKVVSIMLPSIYLRTHLSSHQERHLKINFFTFSEYCKGGGGSSFFLSLVKHCQVGTRRKII